MSKPEFLLNGPWKIGDEPPEEEVWLADYLRVKKIKIVGKWAHSGRQLNHCVSCTCTSVYYRGYWKDSEGYLVLPHLCWPLEMWDGKDQGFEPP